MTGRLPTSAITARRVGCWAALVAGLSLTAAAPGAATEVAGDEGVKQVLIIQSFGSDFAPFNLLASNFRTELAQRSPETVQFAEVSVGASRSLDQTADARLLDYLVALYAGRPPDLVVTVGGPAARFAVASREHLFPSTALLLGGVDRRHLAGAELEGRVAVTPVDQDFVATVENILRVLPRTERLVVVLGQSPLERFWRGELERELEPFAERLELVWWDRLSFEEMLRRAGELPPRSAIFYGTLLVDGAGVPHALFTALTELHAVSTAPIFGLYDVQLGRGIVGGPLVSISEASHLSAEAAARLLAGQDPSAIDVSPVRPGPPVFDWRELRRWGIRESTLPAGSTVLFRPPSMWVAYRWPVLGGLAVIALLASLVVGLVMNRSRRRRAEREVRALSRRLLTALEDERRWLARELHDDLAQRLARLAIDAARIERGDAAAGGEVDLASMRRELGELSSDVHALSRRLHPSLLDELGLEEALRAEVARFGHAESIGVDLVVEEPECALSQDAALCLYRVTQEALNNVARHARATRVEILLRRSADGCRLEVRDDGVGFDPQALAPAPRLGLASMRERVKLVGGTLSLQSAPRQGTTVAAWVPLRGRTS